MPQDVLQKRRVKHDSTVTEYEHRIRKYSIEIETNILDCCNSLKRDLVLSANRTREKIAARCREVRDSVESGILHEEIDSESTIQQARSRRSRILSIKHEMITVYISIVKSTEKRLRAIQNFHSTMMNIDEQRKENIEQLLSTMVKELKTIAWTDDEGCTIMVQQKGTDINISIAHNVRTILDAVHRLHAREVSIEEEFLNVFDTNWTSLLSEMTSSCLTWLGNRMQSGTYLNPPQRTELVSKYLADLIGKSPSEGKPAGLNSILKSSTDAISSLVNSLLLKKENNEEGSWPCPGGCEGWLVGFSNVTTPTAESLQIAHPHQQDLIGSTPSNTVESWRSSLTGFALRLRAVQAQNLSHAIVCEQKLNQQASHEVELLSTDLCCILFQGGEYPQPSLLSSPQQVVFTDCCDSQITISVSQIPNFALYKTTKETSEESEAIFLSKLRVYESDTQWGLVVVFVITAVQGGREFEIEHKFQVDDEESKNHHNNKQNILQQLLDASGVHHTLCNDDLLGSHISECERLISESQQVQQKLSSMAVDDYDFGNQEIRLKPKEMSEELLLNFRCESGIFLSLLDKAMNSSVKLFENIILKETTSLLPCVKGGAIFLEKCTTEISFSVQSSLQDYVIAELDFKDQSNALETNFTNLINQLKQAPDKNKTVDYFKQALNVLRDIQSSYMNIKKEKETLLDSFQLKVHNTRSSLKLYLKENAIDDMKLGELDSIITSTPTGESQIDENTPSTTNQRIERHLQPLLDDTFGLSSIHEGILQSLKTILSTWLESYAESVTTAVMAFCDAEKRDLESWLSERLRLHQRRTPKLASLEFDGRMRELVETEEMKTREFSWIGKRFTSSLNSAQEQVAAAVVQFDIELRNLYSRRQQLPGLQNKTNITVHNKVTAQQIETLISQCDTSFANVKQVIADAEQAMATEGKRYLSEHCQTFSNGGLLSEEEVQQAHAAVESMKSNAAERIEAFTNQTSSVQQSNHNSLADESEKYNQESQHNLTDLELLATLSEHVSNVRSKLSVAVSESLESERRLNVAVSELEYIISHPTVVRKNADGTFEQADSTPESDVSFSNLKNIQSDGFIDQINSELTTLLRRARISSELNLKNSRCHLIVSLLYQVSKQLYSRALFLSVIEKELPFQFISPDTYFSSGTSSEEEGWDKFIQTQPHTVLSNSLKSSFWEKADVTVATYYNSIAEGKRNPTRDSIAETQEGEKEKITESINQLLSQFSSHITTSSSEYKKQVLRISIALPKLPSEVYNVLLQNNLATQRGTVGAAKTLFDILQSRYEAQRLVNGSQIKGSMKNPSNRNVVSSAREKEETRHNNFLLVLSLFHGVLLREEVNCANLLTQQAVVVASKLFTILSSIINVDMINVATDVVVGTHRSLKKLKISIQQQKRNADAPTEATNKKTEAAKPPPKQPSKKDAKGAAAAKSDATAAYVSYPGAPLCQFVGFTNFQKEFPDVKITNHMSAGREQPSPEPVPSAGGKQPSSAVKKNTAAAAKDDEIEASALSPPLEGPNDPIFKIVSTQRNQCLVNFKVHHDEQISRINKLFNELINKEQRWYGNWESLLKSLVPEE